MVVARKSVWVLCDTRQSRRTLFGSPGYLSHGLSKEFCGSAVLRSTAMFRLCQCQSYGIFDVHQRCRCIVYSVQCPVSWVRILRHREYRVRRLYTTFCISSALSRAKRETIAPWCVLLFFEYCASGGACFEKGLYWV